MSVDALLPPHLRRRRAQVLLNPECVTVQRATGSILHAHLLNFEHAASVLAAASLAPPAHFVTQGSNMRWTRPGWDAKVVRSDTSLAGACTAPWDPSSPGASMRHALSLDDAAWSRYAAALLRPGGGAAASAAAPTPPWRVAQMHEGAFFPWSIVRQFVSRLRASLALALPSPRAEPLTALDAVRTIVEEVYLPTFALAALQRQSGGGQWRLPACNSTGGGVGGGVLCRREYHGDAARSFRARAQRLAARGGRPDVVAVAEDFVRELRAGDAFAYKPVDRRPHDVLRHCMTAFTGRAGSCAPRQ